MIGDTSYISVQLLRGNCRHEVPKAISSTSGHLSSQFLRPGDAFGAA